MLKLTGLVATTGISVAGCSDDTSSTPDDVIEPIELMTVVASHSQIQFEFADMVAANWRELGFEVNVDAVDWNTMLDTAILQSDFDTSTQQMAGRAERIDPQFFIFDLFHSSQTGEGSRNFVQYVNEEYDELAEQQQQVYDEEERQELVHECQRILTRDLPHTPIASQDQLMPYNGERFGNTVPMMGEGLMSFWNMLNIEPKTDQTTFRIGYTSDVNNLNPLAVEATHDARMMRLVYDRLVRIGTDGVPEMWAARDITAVDDTTIEVQIRDGMEWHDGEPVTTEDVKFSFEFSDEHSPVHSAKTATIESVEAADETTVVFELAEPYSPFVANTLGYVFLLPKHIWEDVPDEVEAPADWPNEQPIGSGPFEFDYWRRDEEMSFTANENHFSPPTVDQLVVVPGPGMSVLVRMVEQEEIDMVGRVPSPDTIERLEQDVAHIEISRAQNHGYYFLNYQNERAPFSDRAVRRALTYGIPKQDIVDTLMGGYGSVAQSHITEANEFWHNPDAEQFTLDLDAARAELEEAGYRWTDDGRIRYPEEAAQ